MVYEIPCYLNLKILGLGGKKKTFEITSWQFLKISRGEQGEEVTLLKLVDFF